MNSSEDLIAVVERVRAIPYARNNDRSPSGVVTEGRGTCSTKHALLVHLLAAQPELELQVVHRIYRIDRARARELFGERAASFVPPKGLVDVHSYVTALVDGTRRTIDVTFPSDVRWDGRSDMPLACDDGIDVPAVGDPWAHKAELVARYCEPDVREPFIASLSQVS